jgi:polyisoprenoid-binding protein YceI
MKSLITLFCLLTTTAQAELSLKTTPQQGKVEFEAIGKPSMLKIKGIGEGAVADLKVNAQIVSGEIQFDMKSLQTGIDLRDEHMKTKYLQVEQHPHAILQIKDLQLPANWSIKNAALKEQEFKGVMTLHGQQKEISGKFSIKSNKLDGTAEFEIKLSDFKVEIPQYLGVKVADIVKVKVSFNEMTGMQK